MKRTLVIHPFLLGLFFILFVYAQYQELMSLSQIWISALVLLGFAAIVLLLFTLILRDVKRAGMLVFLFLLLFFSYGVVHRALWEGGTEAPASGSQILLITWAVIFVGGAALIIRLGRGLDEITQILNVMALVLVMYSLVDIAPYEFRTRTALQETGETEPIQPVQTRSLQVDELPNIYYIILDGYARADILEELYNYDNSEFLEFLQQRGFFVAAQSQANYVATAESLASSLNLDYLDDEALVGLEFSDAQPLRRMIKDSMVLQFLKQHGYVTVSFSSGYLPTTLDEVDVYLDAGRFWDPWVVLFLTNTPIAWLVSGESQLDTHVPNISRSLHAPHISRIRYLFDHLADTAQLQSPHILFAHVVAPHPPFVFDRSGNEVPQNRAFTLNDGSHFLAVGGTREEYLDGYTGQLSFVNDQMMAVVDDLLSSESSRPAIIILQADHGPGMLLDREHPENTYFKERFAILNAVRLPKGDTAGLYDEMTPVNTFRLIFNRYFGTELELLEDVSYFSTSDRPFELINVTDAVRSGQPARSTE